MSISGDALAIRPATPADRDAVVTLLLAQLREHAIDTPAVAVARTVDALLVRPHRARFLLAVESGRTIGVAAVSLAWPIEHGGRGAWLEELYLEPGARGRGVGTRLLRAACDLAAAAGAVAVDLEVETSHARAANLYAREGFVALARTHWVKRCPSAPAGRTAASPAGADGGCLCGAVRYTVEGAPRIVSHCHCSMCRRATGAPVVTWATFSRTSLRFVRGTPAEFHSTPPVTRTFCAACGTALTFATTTEPGWIDVTVGSMDDPAAMVPDDHIWTESRLPWLVLDDDLPRLPRDHADVK
jgi:GNAT superfamily N-acetyltransferase